MYVLRSNYSRPENSWTRCWTSNFLSNDVSLHKAGENMPIWSMERKEIVEGSNWTAITTSLAVLWPWYGLHPSLQSKVLEQENIGFIHMLISASCACVWFLKATSRKYWKVIVCDTPRCCASTMHPSQSLLVIDEQLCFWDFEPYFWFHFICTCSFQKWTRSCILRAKVGLFKLSFYMSKQPHWSKTRVSVANMETPMS